MNLVDEEDQERNDNEVSLSCENVISGLKDRLQCLIRFPLFLYKMICCFNHFFFYRRSLFLRTIFLVLGYSYLNRILGWLTSSGTFLSRDWCKHSMGSLISLGLGTIFSLGVHMVLLQVLDHFYWAHNTKRNTWNKKNIKFSYNLLCSLKLVIEHWKYYYCKICI